MKILCHLPYCDNYFVCGLHLDLQVMPVFETRQSTNCPHTYTIAGDGKKLNLCTYKEVHNYL